MDSEQLLYERQNKAVHNCKVEGKGKDGFQIFSTYENPDNNKITISRHVSLFADWLSPSQLGGDNL